MIRIGTGDYFEEDDYQNQDCLFYNFQLLLLSNFFPGESVQSSSLPVCVSLRFYFNSAAIGICVFAYLCICVFVSSGGALYVIMP